MTTIDHHQLEPEEQQLLDESLGRWQKRRAGIYCLVVAVLFPLLVFDETRRLWSSPTWATHDIINFVAAYGVALGCALASWTFFRMAPEPRRIARRFGWLLMTSGAILIVCVMLFMTFDPEFFNDLHTPAERVFITAGTALFVLFLIHFIGSLFLALPPWPAMWPLIPLGGLYAASILSMEGPTWIKLTMIGLFPLGGAPGVIWSVWRHERWVDRFKVGLFGDRYDEIRRDLAQARRVHEALFPAPIDSGSTRVRYSYEPLRDVGGDFLFARRLADGRVLVVVVDVTGHGVTSALAVTRIHAVLSLLAGESAEFVGLAPKELSPRVLMARLNGFVHDMLAPQGVYATAIAVEVPGQEGSLSPLSSLSSPSSLSCPSSLSSLSSLSWASAGHPPAVLRRAGGALIELASTCTMLGVLPPSEFDADERSISFMPDDTLVLCTDGLIEAEDRCRVPFGVEGMRAAMADADQALAQRVMDAGRAHRGGARPRDDTLVVEISRVSSNTP